MLPKKPRLCWFVHAHVHTHSNRTSCRESAPFTSGIDVYMCAEVRARLITSSHRIISKELVPKEYIKRFMIGLRNFESKGKLGWTDGSDFESRAWPPEGINVVVNLARNPVGEIASRTAPTYSYTPQQRIYYYVGG